MRPRHSLFFVEQSVQIIILKKDKNEERLLAVVRAALSARVMVNAELEIDGTDRYEVESHRVAGNLEITVSAEEEYGVYCDIILSAIPLH